jgi:hypothetical protein
MVLRMSITAPAAQPRTVYRCGRRRAGVRSGLAAEHGGGYGKTDDQLSLASRTEAPAAPSLDEPRGAVDPGRGGPTPVAANGTAAAVGETAAPFGLPVLAEVPRLASVLGHLDVADRAQLAAVAELADLLAGDEVERVTGVGVDHWLAAVARLTRMDRRLLVRTCRLLHRLPTLDGAVRAGRVSFAQLRGLTLALRGVRRELDGQVDRLLGVLLDELERLERPDPDVLVRQVADAVDELDPDDLADRERDAAADRYFALQPRLDGTGGRVHGDLDAAGLALVDAATAPTARQAADAGSAGAARADLLLHRLAASSDDAGPHAAASDPGPASDSDSDPADGDAAPADGPVLARDGSSWWGSLPPLKLLLRLRFETLLDPDVPAELLTALVGGRLKLTGAAAGRLADERGVLLRTVIVDDQGAVLGVGRATRRPPGWLTDVNLAVHDTCTGPGCDRPALTAQADHGAPWWPTRPDQPAGTTDVANLGPLCDATNRDKEAAGWQVDQTVAGVRTWRHPRSGLTCTTVPATWRPSGDPRHDHSRTGTRHRERHRRRPDGTDPPGHHGTGPVPHGPPRNDRAVVPPGPEAADDLPF